MNFSAGRPVQVRKDKADSAVSVLSSVFAAADLTALVKVGTSVHLRELNNWPGVLAYAAAAPFSFCFNFSIVLLVAYLEST